MPRIVDYNGQDADRTVTVASIVALKNEDSVAPTDTHAEGRGLGAVCGICCRAPDG